MRLLLDECMPRRFGRALTEDEVETVQSMQWRGLKNGALLQRIRTHSFDVFITIDRGIPFQQNLRDLPFATIVIRAQTNDAEVIVALVPHVRETLRTIKPGDLVILQGTAG